MLLPRVQLAETRPRSDILMKRARCPWPYRCASSQREGRGIPFLALPTREQHNVDRNDGEDQPERRDRFLTGEERRLKKADWVSEELC
jgi:hypothetical protein